MNTSTDNELMLRVKAGELDCLNILFSKYQPLLSNFFANQSGNRELSKDLTQDTFWRILRYRNTFDGRHSFKSWMFQIGRNVFYDHCKKTKHFSTHSGEAFGSIDVADSTATEQSVEKSESHQLLQKALQLLSPEKREVLVLARFENLQYKEIAGILGCSVSNVKIRVYRALNELKTHYESLTKEPA